MCALQPLHDSIKSLRRHLFSRYVVILASYGTIRFLTSQGDNMEKGHTTKKSFDDHVPLLCKHSVSLSWIEDKQSRHCRCRIYQASFEHVGVPENGLGWGLEQRMESNYQQTVRGKIPVAAGTKVLPTVHLQTSFWLVNYLIKAVACHTYNGVPNWTGIFVGCCSSVTLRSTRLICICWQLLEGAFHFLGKVLAFELGYNTSRMWWIGHHASPPSSRAPKAAFCIYIEAKPLLCSTMIQLTKFGSLIDSGGSNCSSRHTLKSTRQ